MQNGEKCTFYTHGDQHGDRHGASHDVADVSHDPTVTKTKSPRFAKVAFTIRGMAIGIPYKSESVKGLKHSSPLSHFFSHTNLSILTCFPGFCNTINRG